MLSVMGLFRRACIFVVACCLPLSTSAEVARFSPFDDQRVATDEQLMLGTAPARTGGALKMGALGSFDNINSLAFGGRLPSLMSLPYDSLLVRSHSETAAFYGLLATKIDVSDDFSRMRLKLDPRARWHDGTALTAHDVKFTFDTLMSGFSGAMLSAFGKMEIVVHDDHDAEFVTSLRGDWRWIREISWMPIHSHRYWEGRNPDQITLDAPLASGPYRVTKAEMSHSFVLTRVEDYWAQDHPAQTHFFHFDRIGTEYFADPIALIQSLARRDIDMVRETNPARRRTGYSGPAFDAGEVVKTTLKDENAVAIPVLVFNLRRSPTDNVALRKALQLMYDVDWVLETQGNVATAAHSFYGDMRLAAEGLPGAAEIDLLVGHSDILPDGIFTQPAPGLVVTNTGLRDRRRRAIDLLEREGFFFRDGRVINPETDMPLLLKLVTSDGQFVQELAPFQTWLDSIGITLEFSVQDASATREIVQNTQDFDITTVRWRAFDPPGRNEDFFLHSRHADTGFGATGLKSPVADALIDTMLQSRDDAQIVAAARAFDRYLRWNAYILPLWQQDAVWFAHDANLTHDPRLDANSEPAMTWRWKTRQTHD